MEDLCGHNIGENHRKEEKLKKKNRKKRNADEKYKTRESTEESSKQLQEQDLSHDSSHEKPEDILEGSPEDILELMQSKVYKFDEASCSPNVCCYGNTVERQIVKQSTDGARGLVGIQDGCHVFKLTFGDVPWGSHCSIGVVSSDVALHVTGYGHLLGHHPEAWCWDIPSRSLRHNGQVLGIYPEQEEQSKDIQRTMEMVIDRDQRNISLDIGHGHTMIFDDLPDSSVVLYPAVSMVYGKSRATIELLSSALHSKYSWLSAVQTAPAAHKQQLQDQPTSNAESFETSISGKSSGDRHQNCSNGDHDIENSTEHATRENVRETSQDEAEHQQKDESGGAEVTSAETDKVPEETDAEGPAEESAQEEPASNINTADLDRTSQENVDEMKEGDQFVPYHRKKSVESSSEEEEKEEFLQESSKVTDLTEDDKYFLKVAHSWDYVNRASLIQPCPNMPSICVPMPSLQDKVQGIRCRSGFSGRGIHTWEIRELIMYSPTVHANVNDMASATNNVIVGVASDEQRQFNFGFSLHEVGQEIWGLQYPDMKTWHGRQVDDVTSTDADHADVLLSDGLEMTLNTVTHKLTFTSKGHVLAEMVKVKGKKLYPFVLYNASAHWPIEITYLEGPLDYIQDTLNRTRQVADADREDVNNVRVLMKRSSSTRELMNPHSYRDRYIWGSHSTGMAISDKSTATLEGSQGAALALYPIGGSRHKISFVIDGSIKGLAIGLVHSDYPVNITDEKNLSTSPSPCYLGNDLLSWCWDIDNRRVYHACRFLGRYPIDKDFDPVSVISYTLTLDFSALGYNTASFTAHTQDKDKPSRELGIAFVRLPPKVLPAVVMRGRHQSVRMGYVSGPWKVEDAIVEGAQSSENPSSRTCSIL